MSTTSAPNPNLAYRSTSEGGDASLVVNEPPNHAAGIGGVYWAMRMALPAAGPVRAALALKDINQVGGFDCSGCAWPDPKHRSFAEFCENGAKAVAEEATTKTISPKFFERNTLTFLAEQSDYWLGHQGRLAHPVIKRAGSDNYEPISWDEAYDRIADKIKSLQSPDDAVFYTSGRTSNEAAYMYQLFTRAIGTNNLPDCSNMCHESSGNALGTTLGIGKGTVTLEDVEVADLLIIAGQNPGTNHPRMLTSLERQKKNGGKIIAINPLPEAGLIQFHNPQKVDGIVGTGTDLTDVYVPVRLRGDLAFFQGVVNYLYQLEAERGDVFDHAFIESTVAGYDELTASQDNINWDDIEESAGVSRDEMKRVAEMIADAKSVTICWAMGLTQHKDSVAALKEIVNVLLLTGNIGKPGAGACPVRGHSNVQGDRTMGIWEYAKPEFMDALKEEFNFDPPRDTGYDVVETLHAAKAGKVKFFMAMGGNFMRATPDSQLTERVMSEVDMSVHVSTKLNGSHVRVARDCESIILPTLVRSERDEQASGLQRVTVEDSMGMVHASAGLLDPISDHLHSEPRIVAELGQRVANRGDIPWAKFADDYATVRASIERTIPGFDNYEERINDPGGFALPNPPRDSRSFATPDGKAHMTVNELEVLRMPQGHLILQTLRSHDQYNTTIYGMDDRYRGIKAGRRVIFMNKEDIAFSGLEDGQIVDITSHWDGADGHETRTAEAFRVVEFDIARGCAAAYFPEANVLVPLGATADKSNTPASKSLEISVAPTAVKGLVPVT